MAITNTLSHPVSAWMDGSGHLAQIAISSRVRLARNLREEPFPHLLSDNQGRSVVEKIKEAIGPVNSAEPGLNLELAMLNELSQLDRQLLVEKHIMSPQHAGTPTNRAIIISEKEILSIMVNEEDHLRIQCLLSGLQLEEAWNRAVKTDDLLESRLNYAFDVRLGYLTACPTNIGTGLRASVMMHLPGLAMTNQANRVLQALSQLGLAVRGMYGEGTEAVGNLLQISNQITLGKTEDEIINNLSLVTKQVIEQEKMARNFLLKEAQDQLEDRIGRAFGVLTNARIINSQEAMGLLSDMRLGIDLGILKNIDHRDINELLVSTRPSYLQKISNHELSSQERDKKRAEVIRSKLGGASIC